MELPELSQSQLLALCDCFELSYDPLIDSCGGEIEGIPYWELKHFKKLFSCESWEQWFPRVGYSGMYESFHNDDPTITPIYKDNGRYWYRCLHTLREIDLADYQRAAYQVNLHLFLDYLSSMLKVAPINNRSVVEHWVWRLGNLSLSDRHHFPVYLVRCLGQWVDAASDYFRNVSMPVIVLGASRTIPRHIALPRNIIAINLCESLHDVRDSVMMAVRHFDPIPFEDERGGRQAPSPVSYDSIRQILSINGKPNWHIQGERKAAVVKYLFEQYKVGRSEIPSREIIEAVRSPGQHGGSLRMQSFFHRDECWKTYIISPRRGRYSLNF